MQSSGYHTYVHINWKCTALKLVLILDLNRLITFHAYTRMHGIIAIRIHVYVFVFIFCMMFVYCWFVDGFFVCGALVGLINSCMNVSKMPVTKLNNFFCVYTLHTCMVCIIHSFSSCFVFGNSTVCFSCLTVSVQCMSCVS